MLGLPGRDKAATSMRSHLRKVALTPFTAGGKAVDARGQGAWSRRARLMLRHTWLLVTGACLLIGGLAALSFYYASRPTTLTFALPGGNPEDVRLVQTLAQQFAKDRAPVRLQPMTVDGPLQSAAALDAGKADLAIVRGDLAMPSKGLAVAVLRENVAVMIVPAAGSPAKAKPAGKPKAKPKKIDKIEDLPGHRIGVIGRTGGVNNVEVLNVVLRQYEIAPDKVTVVPISADDVGAALRKDPVDVIFAVGPVSSRFIAEAIAAASTAKQHPRFLAIGASEAIANRLPAYESTELKEGVFGGKHPLPDDSVETIAFRHYIVARRSVSESKIADFTRLLFSIRQTLKQDIPAVALIEKPDTDKDAVVQSHPGAAAYLDNDQKTFFDRYSDLLYWGMILMGFVGSAVTWLTSYTRADDRVRRMREIEHLLDIVAAAHRADSIEELDRLRAEADAVLKKTLQQVEYNNLDESALMAFSLALDQAQLAIADRRSTLASRRMQQTIEAGALESPHGEPAGPPSGSSEVAPLRLALKTADQG